MREKRQVKGEETATAKSSKGSGDLHGKGGKKKRKEKRTGIKCNLPFTG